MSNDLIARARDRAETAPAQSQLGYRVALDENEHFSGRWRGETADPDNDDRPVYLLWDEHGQRCFSRTYVALARELKKATPRLGDSIVLYRGTDYLGKGGNPGHSFGVAVEPNAEPLPDDGDEDTALDEDGIPF